MDFLILIIKSIASLFALFILTNALGKKQINQLNMFDYVIGISIGNVVAEMTVNKEVVFIDGIIVMTIYSLISIFVSYLGMKSLFFRKLVCGTPVILIENGKINEKDLKKTRIDINELLEEARINGYFDITEIEYALMETNGKISFLPKSKYKPITKNDLKMDSPYKGLSLELIIDGEIILKNLKKINKSKKWLITRLNNMNFYNIDNVLLAIIDTDEKISVYEKS